MACDRARQGNGYSALPIQHTEFQAWSWLHGERLAAWELDALARMDNTRLLLLSDEVDKPVSAPPLTPKIFRTLFGEGAVKTLPSKRKKQR